MKLDSIFSIKDYLNYYIAGLLWCVSGILFAKETLLKAIEYFTSTPIETGGLFILGSLLILFPYVVGFTLNPLGTEISIFWQGKNRKWHPDPRKHVLMTDQTPNQSSSVFAGKRIPENETNQIISRARKVFKIDYKKDIHLYFLPIRAYSLEYGGATAQQAERGRDLQNFTQSLLIPVPLVVIAVAASLFWGKWLSFAICLVVALILHRMLVARYFEMESYWVKHVYRSFLVITSKDGNLEKNE